jgi:hypothetical protein
MTHRRPLPGASGLTSFGSAGVTTPTLRSIREMIRRCQDADHHRASISTKQEVNGLSATEQLASAQAALNQIVQALKSGSLNTSARSINHN